MIRSVRLPFSPFSSRTASLPRNDCPAHWWSHVAALGRSLLVLTVMLMLCGTPALSQQSTNQGARSPSVGKTAGGRRSRSRQDPRQNIQPVPGYTYQVIEGFQVLIHKDVLAHQNDPRFARSPVDVLQHELKLISGLLPSRPVALIAHRANLGGMEETGAPRGGCRLPRRSHATRSASERYLPVRFRGTAGQVQRD